LFYYLIFGVPGAIAYRAVNTLDAMLGYHGEYEYRGKFAARLDDVLNYIPARITALLLVLAAFLSRQNGCRAWRTARREHGRTESPNAGWPMAAAAGALGGCLEKDGAYTLGTDAVSLDLSAIASSLRLLWIAMILWVVACLATGGIQLVLRA
jgi:adenosylcobinamide-phosphate synthase